LWRDDGHGPVAAAFEPVEWLLAHEIPLVLVSYRPAAQVLDFQRHLGCNTRSCAKRADGCSFRAATFRTWRTLERRATDGTSWSSVVTTHLRPFGCWPRCTDSMPARWCSLG
jgi:hypothetical protein